MKRFSPTDLGFLTLMLAAILLFLATLMLNIQNSLYPPLYKPIVIDVAAVRERIRKAGLQPREASHYRVIEKDSRGNIREIKKPREKPGSTE